MTDVYDDIINLPHHVSDKHPHMPAIDRAAQFSPFSALTGFGAAITETGRLTDKRIELVENEKVALNEKLSRIQEQLGSQVELTVTYFRPDEKKSGGTYVTFKGTVKKIDEHERVVVMENRTKIPIDDIVDINVKSQVAE
jgi:hypothetical protein